mmetsp:Transcript_11227/g.12857  ORF Transcript_11227/g.12857 Transcript_11227/m.12857 type:complete len:198 (-) Transcript_11227:70-663(-)
MPTFKTRRHGDEAMMKSTKKAGFYEADSTRSLESLSGPDLLPGESAESNRSLLDSIKEENKNKNKSDEGNDIEKKASENKLPLLLAQRRGYSTSSAYSNSLEDAEESIQTLESTPSLPRVKLARMKTVDLEEAENIFRKQQRRFSGDSPFSYMFKSAEMNQSDEKSINLKLLGVILTISIICFILGLVTGIVIVKTT